MENKWLIAVIALGVVCVVCDGLAMIWYGPRAAMLVSLAMTMSVWMCMAIRDQMNCEQEEAQENGEVD